MSNLNYYILLLYFTFFICHFCFSSSDVNEVSYFTDIANYISKTRLLNYGLKIGV